MHTQASTSLGPDTVLIDMNDSEKPSPWSSASDWPGNIVLLPWRVLGWGQECTVWELRGGPQVERAQARKVLSGRGNSLGKDRGVKKYGLLGLPGGVWIGRKSRVETFPK